MGVFDDLKEECRSGMLHDNLNISRLMVNDQQVEETRVKRKSKETNRDKLFDGGSSNGRIDIQDKTKFKMRFSKIVPSKFLKARDDRVSTPKPKKGRDTNSPTKNRTCGNYVKKHYGD